MTNTTFVTHGHDYTNTNAQGNPERTESIDDKNYRHLIINLTFTDNSVRSRVNNFFGKTLTVKIK